MAIIELHLINSELMFCANSNLAWSLSEVYDDDNYLAFVLSENKTYDTLMN